MNKYKVRCIQHHSAEYELRESGFDPSYLSVALSKYEFKLIKIKALKAAAANILKQTALSKGADAGVATGVVNCSRPYTDVVLAGTKKQLKDIINALKEQPFGLKALAGELENLLFPENSFKLPLKIRNNVFEWGKKTHIMGVLNLTPDSFSDGGTFISPDDALKHVQTMIENNVDIIDIGAESTRPFSQSVDCDTQIKRIEPVLKEIRIRYPEIPISIDTRSHNVARHCLKLGADIINDVSGLRHDNELINIIADYNCPIIIMHSLTTPETMQVAPNYKHLIDEIYAFFTETIEQALQKGVKEENIIVDPGIGFGKTFEHNLELIRRASEFHSLNKPLLYGVSRKAFLGKITTQPAQGRDFSTTAVNSYLVSQGVDILRVHNVALLAEATAVLDVILK